MSGKDGRKDRGEYERRQVRRGLQTEGRVQRLSGRVLSVLGLLMALSGDLTPGEVGPAGPVGLLMGSLGYLLGARVLGTTAMVLSVAEIVVGIVTG